MKAIFPSSIDGYLLKLVLMSNGFHMVEGTSPLEAGDVCHSEAKIVSVVNANEGKIIKVKGLVYRGEDPVIEVVSSFLYRRNFIDFQNTFDTTKEVDYSVALATDADVGVLQSKEWFDWLEEDRPLVAGTSLIFRIESEVAFQAKGAYRDVQVVGDVFIRNQLKELVKVASVDFQQEDSQGNPVLSYLQRHGEALGLATPLPEDGYLLAKPDVPSTFRAPLTNEPYSKVSGDFNPIHINPYFSCYASLPCTITHGMFSSAATRRYIESVVVQGHPERVVS